MPAKSKAQQRFMGMVRATQKGEEPASAKVAKAAQSMDPKDTEDFASTKHKGLPEKKKEEQKLREMIRDMIVVVESDLPITTRKGKTVTVVHKRSGKELVITNTPSARKKYKRMGYLVNEANTSEIRKKLLKKFGDDPLYKEFILAKTPKEQKKALDTLKSIRGSNAIRLMQKYTKKLQKESINESREIGGYYMMKQLKDLAHDAKRNRETKLHKAFMYLYDRINQSYRDIDLNVDDINDLLKEPRGRKHKSNIPTWMIDDLFEGKTNEAVQINIDDLLKNSKVQKLLKTFGVKRDENAVIKLLNYFAINPSQLKRYGFA